MKKDLFTIAEELGEANVAPAIASDEMWTHFMQNERETLDERHKEFLDGVEKSEYFSSIFTKAFKLGMGYTIGIMRNELGDSND